MSCLKLPSYCGVQIARAALPRVSMDLIDMGEYVAPTNRIEGIIQAAWEDTLSAEPGSIGTHMNFFEVRQAVEALSSDMYHHVRHQSYNASVYSRIWQTTLEPNCAGSQVGGNSLKAGIALSKIREMLNAPEIPGEHHAALSSVSCTKHMCALQTFSRICP